VAAYSLLEGQITSLYVVNSMVDGRRRREPDERATVLVEFWSIGCTSAYGDVQDTVSSPVSMVEKPVAFCHHNEIVVRAYIVCEAEQS
jgi:hypothetical protein